MKSVNELRLKVNDPAIDITFRNVTYSVDVIDKNDHSALHCFANITKKQLLSGATGIFKAGEVTAIMGASGAGKTTLLNVLARRTPRQAEDGEMRANGTEYGFEDFGDFANYVMQADRFFETLTVRETLRFAADLKLNVTDEAKKEAIRELAGHLKLEDCLDTLVGGHFVKGISGGEKKRTSIAFELISDPQVLMLDQPTSGLDSLTSFIIVRHLSHLAKTRHKTIAMTIHQPNPEIFALFDKLLLMVEGQLIYQGPAASAIGYFAEQFGLVCPEFHNPADFFMSVMHQENRQNVERYPQYFAAYEKHFAKAVEADI